MGTPTVDAALLERVDRASGFFETQEALIHAFVPENGRFSRLHQEAEGLAQRFPPNGDRPACYGLLAGVKDIFHVDGLATLAGSRLPPDALKGTQAECVSALKSAGALILGKTVTTEFAYFAPGPTRNPRNREHTPGGSSSGSAAAVAAGLCTFALGTQTIGSIIRPAAFCGVVGLKPTYDRVSRQGVIPLSPSLDHVGCFAQDAATARRIAPSLYRDWDAAAVHSMRPILGIPEGPYLESATDTGLAHFRGICQVLREAGYEVRSVAVLADYAQVRARHDIILSAEAAGVHATWFEAYEKLYADQTATLIRRGQQISAERLSQALDERAAWRHEIHAVMEREGIDLWISPAATGAAPKGLERTGDPVMNLPWTQAGLPALNLPSGTDSQGLPLGLQVAGQWGADEALLHWSEELEGILGRP